MGVSSLPKTVTRQRHSCDLNPGLSAPESSTLTTRLPSHPVRKQSNNNNNNNNHDNVYCLWAIIMTKVIARVHPVHLTNTYTGYSFILSSHTVAENKYNKQKLNKRNEKIQRNRRNGSAQHLTRRWLVKPPLSSERGISIHQVKVKRSKPLSARMANTLLKRRNTCTRQSRFCL